LYASQFAGERPFYEGERSVESRRRGGVEMRRSVRQRTDAGGGVATLEG
jgi:hypothetical protein